MRIIILSASQIYANKVVKELIEEFNKEIVLIAEPKSIIAKKSLYFSLKKLIHISGFEYVFYQAVKMLLFKLIGKFYTHFFPKDSKNKFFLKESLAKLYKINIVKLSDANNKQAFKIFLKLKPDLIVSVFFNQLLDKKILEIPRLGAINIHPGLLPGYRGTSPIYWSLVNGEKFTGVSIHKIDEGIDTGGIYKKVKIEIDDQDTEDSLYWKSVCKGSGELIDVIKKLKKGNLKTVSNKGGRFFSFPSRESIKQFKQNKRSFLRLRQFISLN